MCLCSQSRPLFLFVSVSYKKYKKTFYLPGHFNSFQNENPGFIELSFYNTCLCRHTKYINRNSIYTKQTKRKLINEFNKKKKKENVKQMPVQRWTLIWNSDFPFVRSTSVWPNECDVCVCVCTYLSGVFGPSNCSALTLQS